MANVTVAVVVVIVPEVVGKAPVNPTPPDPRVKIPVPAVVPAAAAVVNDTVPLLPVSLDWVVTTHVPLKIPGVTPLAVVPAI